MQLSRKKINKKNIGSKNILLLLQSFVTLNLTQCVTDNYKRVRIKFNHVPSIIINKENIIFAYNDICN